MTPGNNERRTFVITGVSGGIGSTLLEAFASRVEAIYTSSRRAVSDFWDARKQGPWPENAVHLEHDLTDEQEVMNLFSEVMAARGGIDAVINCVGGSLFSHPIVDFPADEFDEVLRVNLRSAFLITKHAMRAMMRAGATSRKGSNIVHLVSSSAKKISRGKAPYGTAKAGLAHFIHYAASEGASHDIRVNGISPTYVFTPRHEADIAKKFSNTGKSRDEIISGILSNQLLKHPMYPDDLVDVAWILATTRCITGQVYNVSMGEILTY